MRWEEMSKPLFMSDLRKGDLLEFTSYGKKSLWLIIDFDSEGFGFWGFNDTKRYFSAWDLVNLEKLS